VQAGYLDAQLSPITRLWQGNMSNMKFKIEVEVINPVGLIEIEGHFGQLAPENGGAMQAAFKHRQYVLEPHNTIRAGGLIVDGDTADQHREALQFRVQKHRIRSA
jgi:hypothetical protein